jgi:hypothetical protein
MEVRLDAELGYVKDHADTVIGFTVWAVSSAAVLPFCLTLVVEVESEY